MVGGAEHDVYLPLQIAQKNKPAPSRSYRLVVIPGAELKELYVTISTATSDGRPLITNGEPLGYGYYPPNRTVEIPVLDPPKPGIYRLQVGAMLRDGLAATEELWFYHSGNAR